MVSLPAQPAILSPVPPLARYLSFNLVPAADPRRALAQLARLADGHNVVVGIGLPTLARLGKHIEGLHEVPSFPGAKEPIPSTPRALWLWLRGQDRGELLHRGFTLTAALEEAYQLDDVTDAFTYKAGHDLTGYEDGTENPKAEDAEAAALIANATGPGIVGGSFVAVQHWLHDLQRFGTLSQAERDAAIGRRLSDNQEIEDAPTSAHVKRTAQESFEPEAFVLRRSMPWVHGTACGLEFVAFAHSLYAFEAQLQRMLGIEDGVADALFSFSRPLTTSYYFCPPLFEGQLDLRALDI